MNKEQTTIEEEAFEWWNNKLNYVQCLQLINKYFPDVIGVISRSQIATIYKAEHPTATTAENNNDEYLKKALKDCASVYAENTLYDTLKQENKKLLEDNKLLREALQKINNIEDGAFGLSNFDVARFKKDIQQALEQTK